MLTVQGYFKEGRFISSEIEKIPEYRNAIVVVSDERVSYSDDNANVWLNFLDTLETIDEESPIEFERASLSREVEI